MLILDKKSLLLLVILVIALAFRLPDLSERPIHGDEAVNAVKFSQLLESGKFVYNPTEYHGPSLYYFTLPASWISGNTSLKELTETTVRIVPVIFGVGLILLLFMLRSGLGWFIPLLAALFLAISPAFVFYSRYYIHEMLLVFFCYLSIFSGYRYSKSQTNYWAILTGFSIGLMISTKETWVIVVLAIIISIKVIFLPFKDRREILLNFIKSIPLKHIIGFSVTLFLTIVLLYSSFLQHPEGIKNSLSAYSSYIQRAGNNEFHVHPWYMYFYWLLCFSGPDGSFWSEGVIAFLAIAGVIGIFIKKHFDHEANIFFYFIIIFVLSTTFIFSLIPYKTPWNFLTFWFGFILIGAAGFVYIFDTLNQKIFRAIFVMISLTAIIHLGWQSYQLNFVNSYAITNPYVYAHPVDDVILITEKLDKIAQKHHDGYKIHIQVIAGDNDYWPLPWYLRKFDRVGWWDRVDLKSASAPVIITRPDLEKELISKLYEVPPPGSRHLYLPLFEGYTELRPGIEIRGYIRKDVWDKLNTVSNN
jgi:uncharacterized protein (TIGR03663 family)